MIDIVSWAQVEDDIYFRSYQTCPGIFKYNLDDKKMVAIDDFNKWIKCDCFRTAAIGYYIIFLPYYRTHEFLIYDTKKKSFKRIEKCYKDCKYRSSVVFENVLYMIPDEGCSLEEIATFDPRDESIDYPYKNVKVQVDINSFANAVIDNGNVYLPLRGDNQILKLNLIGRDYEILSVGEREERYGVILKVDEEFYLSGEKNYLYLWDGKDKVDEIPLANKFRKNEIPWKQKFSDVILLGNNLFFAPLNYPSVISLGLEDLKVNYVYELEDIYDISWGFEKFKNSIFMSITDIHGNNGKQYIISILNNEIIMNEQEVFKLDEDVDLCRYGFEYSEFALKRFIRNVVES